MSVEFGTGYDTGPIPITFGTGGIATVGGLTVRPSTGTGVVSKEATIPPVTTTPVTTTPVTTTTTPAPAPTASFAFTVKAGKIVEFTNASQNAVSYLWNFGDGTTSTQKDPVKIYNAFQSYTVKLTVKNSDGVSASYSAAVNVVNMTPDANFTYLVGGFTGYFTNTSNASATTYKWEFGDGSTSSEKSPTYTYSGNGTFTVKLTVNGTYTKQVNITIDTEILLEWDGGGADIYHSLDGVQWTRITTTGLQSLGITQAVHGVDSAQTNLFRIVPVGGDVNAAPIYEASVQC